MYCLDTDIAIEYLRGNKKVVGRIDQQQEKITTTPVTVSELYYGAYRSERWHEQAIHVRKFAAAFPVLEYTPAVAETFGRIKSELMGKGEVVDNFDLLIGAFCIVQNRILITNNTKHFSRIPGLKIENWMV